MPRMLLMMPVMMYASKIDYDDPQMVLMLRFGYLFEQAVLLLVCFFIYTKVKANVDATTIYIKPPPTLGAQSQSWTKTTYRDHENSTFSQLFQQLLFSAGLTLLMHFQFKIKQAILIQALMTPMTFVESGLVKKYVLGFTSRVYGEMLEGEPRDGEDAIEEDGQSTGRGDAGVGGASAPPAEQAPVVGGRDSGGAELKQLISATWDAGKAADVAALAKALTPSTVDTFGNNEATALMVVAASHGDVTEATRRILDLGADVRKTDEGGWTALHWASFHSNPSSTRVLCGVPGVKGLLAMKDEDGETPLQLAKGETKKVEGAVADLRKECKANPSNADAKRDFEVRASQLARCVEVVKILSSAASSVGGATAEQPDENMEEID